MSGVPEPRRSDRNKVVAVDSEQKQMESILPTTSYNRYLNFKVMVGNLKNSLNMVNTNTEKNKILSELLNLETQFIENAKCENKIPKAVYEQSFKHIEKLDAEIKTLISSESSQSASGAKAKSSSTLPSIDISTGNSLIGSKEMKASNPDVEAPKSESKSSFNEEKVNTRMKNPILLHGLSGIESVDTIGEVVNGARCLPPRGEGIEIEKQIAHLELQIEMLKRQNQKLQSYRGFDGSAKVDSTDALSQFSTDSHLGDISKVMKHLKYLKKYLLGLNVWNMEVTTLYRYKLDIVEKVLKGVNYTGLLVLLGMTQDMFRSLFDLDTAPNMDNADVLAGTFID